MCPQYGDTLHTQQGTCVDLRVTRRRACLRGHSVSMCARGDQSWVHQGLSHTQVHLHTAAATSIYTAAPTHTAAHMIGRCWQFSDVVSGKRHPEGFESKNPRQSDPIFLTDQKPDSPRRPDQSEATSAPRRPRAALGLGSRATRGTPHPSSMRP